MLVTLTLLANSHIGFPTVHAAQVQPQVNAVIAVNPGKISSSNILPGASVSFAFNLTSKYSNYTAYQVSFSYNNSVLKAVSIVDNNVLGTATSALENCIDDVGTCSSFDNPGVVSYWIFQLCQICPTPTPNATLFSVNFNVIRQGFTQLHIFIAALATGGAGATQLTQAFPIDGYFNDLHCGVALCTPPVALFTVTPSRIVPTPLGNVTQVIQASTVTFNARATYCTDNSTSACSIRLYNWFWGDGSINYSTAKPVSSHIYQLANVGVSGVPNGYILTLQVTDNFGITSSKSFLLEVIRIWVDLSIESPFLVPSVGVLPGTPVEITVRVSNLSVLDNETPTVHIFVENASLTSYQFGLMTSGNKASFTYMWNTASYAPGAYLIKATVDPVTNSTTGQVIDNNTSDKVGYGWVQLIEPLPPGFGSFLGLSLTQTLGVSIIAIFALGFGYGSLAKLFRKKPQVA